jgi:hypothetical protein
MFVSGLSSEHLFPLPKEDEGFSSLLDIPFVELPNEWIGKSETDKPRKFDITYGLRALPVTEYVHALNKDEYDHKWNDTTLTEAKPMQVWRAWQFDLSEELPGVSGNIRDAVKITISPHAKRMLYSCPDDVPLRWPNLD